MEHCPFCGSSIRPQATVCAGCGALKGLWGGSSMTAAQAAIGMVFLPIFGVIFPFLFARSQPADVHQSFTFFPEPVQMLVTIAPWLIMAMAFAIGGFCGYIFFARPVRWYRYRG